MLPVWLLFPLGLQGRQLGVHRVAGVNETDPRYGGKNDQNRQYMLQMRIRVLFRPVLLVGHKACRVKANRLLSRILLSWVNFLFSRFRAGVPESAGHPLKI